MINIELILPRIEFALNNHYGVGAKLIEGKKLYLVIGEASRQELRPCAVSFNANAWFGSRSIKSDLISADRELVIEIKCLRSGDENKGTKLSEIRNGVLQVVEFANAENIKCAMLMIIDQWDLQKSRHKFVLTAGEKNLCKCIRQVMIGELFYVVHFYIESAIGSWVYKVWRYEKSKGDDAIKENGNEN